MIKILFVCTGNICRSPLAEGIIREKFRKNNITGEVDSCGFESFHVGDPPDSRAQEVAGKRGIDLSSHRARLFTVEDFDKFDYIYAMDSSHYDKITRLARNDADMMHVDFMLNVVNPGKNLDVEDPWYHGLKAFEKVYLELDEACDRIVDQIIIGSALK
ncbi:MAG: low molecular weight phosphotyrosine protein phosphatase [Bacteroidetes bacterium]|nr:low molecular weight phosphotyrosine protein phosphatase [Bacteroidota bacterium]